MGSAARPPAPEPIAGARGDGTPVTPIHPDESKTYPPRVDNSEPGRADITFRRTDEAAGPGKTHLYDLRIAWDDGKLAWASPP